MPTTKTLRPDLLRPDMTHPKCAARLAALLSGAWEKAGYGPIEAHSLFFVLPAGGQRKQDVYRCSASFSAGLTYYIDSWNTMTEMIKYGVRVVKSLGDIEFEANPNGL